MKKIKQLLGGELHQYTMAIALVVLIVFFNIASGGRMITSSNFQNLLSGNSYVLVLAIGMLMVIVVGHIDLSIGSVASFCSMSMAIMSSLVYCSADRYFNGCYNRCLAGILDCETWDTGIYHDSWRNDDFQRRCNLDFTINFRTCTAGIKMVRSRVPSGMGSRSRNK